MYNSYFCEVVFALVFIGTSRVVVEHTSFQIHVFYQIAVEEITTLRPPAFELLMFPLFDSSRYIIHSFPSL